MARQVSVEKFQQLQRGGDITADPETIDVAVEDAAAAEALRRIGAPINGKGQPKSDPTTDAFEHLRQVGRGQVTPCSHAVIGLHGICTSCAEYVGEAETPGAGSALFAEQTRDEESGYDGPMPEAEFTDAEVNEMAAEAGIGVAAESVPDAMTRLVAREMPLLNVGATCSEEMNLGMVVDRVREAVLATDWGKLATDAEIVAEAERIFAGFSVNRKGPREYTVDPSGEVRDWRRPDTTPDRGDVTATHTVTDDEPRFSGGGTMSEGERPMAQCIPQDIAFHGKLYRDAPDLANIAETLIDRHGFLEGLIKCEIRYFWKRKTGVSKGRVKIGYCKRASDLLGHFTGADFIVWLSATTARDGKFTDRQVEAALFHQLLHIGTDDSGNFIFAPHDFEGFGAEIRHYGTWTEDLKLGGTAFVAAHQMGLFTDEDEGVEDDDDEGEQMAWEPGGPMPGPLRDGAGILIHADGTPFTDDEIAEMERRELADDPI